MKSVRKYSSALGLVVALIASTTASAYIAAAHPICTVKHHDCGKSPTIRPCCCGDQTNSYDETGPITAKVTVSAVPIHTAVVFADVVTPPLMPAGVHPQDSPPRAAQFDLQSLFSIFLI